MKEAKKADVIRDLRRIQRRIWRIPIAAETADIFTQQIQTMQFAVASVNTVISFLEDITEVQNDRTEV